MGPFIRWNIKNNISALTAAGFTSDSDVDITEDNFCQVIAVNLNSTGIVQHCQCNGGPSLGSMIQYISIGLLSVIIIIFYFKWQ